MAGSLPHLQGDTRHSEYQREEADKSGGRGQKVGCLAFVSMEEWAVTGDDWAQARSQEPWVLGVAPCE